MTMRPLDRRQLSHVMSPAHELRHIRPRRRAAPRQRRFAGAVEMLEPRMLLAFDPSPMEQAMLVDLNRMRTDPLGELTVLFDQLDPLHAPDPEIQQSLEFFDVDAASFLAQWLDLQPVPPLAWNESLQSAAAAHSQRMLQFDQQSHQLPGESSAGDRVRAAGYPWIVLAENLYAFAQSTLHAHAAFAIDWGDSPTGIQEPPGHRNTMMDGRVQEVGISILPTDDPQKSVGPLLVTQDFGRRSDYQPQIVGVVFHDRNENGRYDAGEGLGGVEIVVTGPSGTYHTTTKSAGGYQRVVPAGTYTIIALATALTVPIQIDSVTIDRQNVNVDLAAQLRSPLPGDSNHDGQFDRLDLVLVLQAGKYGSAQPARFEEGDWNVDGVFDRLDIVFVLQARIYT